MMAEIGIEIEQVVILMLNCIFIAAIVAVPFPDLPRDGGRARAAIGFRSFLGPHTSAVGRIVVDHQNVDLRRNCSSSPNPARFVRCKWRRSLTSSDPQPEVSFLLQS